MSRRTRTLGDVIPLAACEPDGLLVATTGAYVRLLDCPGPLQPLRGGREHRDAIRGQLAALASRVAPEHGLQVVIEANELDVDAELARDWQQIAAAAARTQQHGHRERGEAMRRFGYGLEQTLRRSAPLVQAQQLSWTIATRALPTPADWPRVFAVTQGLASAHRRAART